MNLRKKILGFLTVIGLGLCVFTPSSMMGNIAHAVTPFAEASATEAAATAANQQIKEPSSVEEARKGFWDFIDIGLKMIYIVIRPLLFLAGIALDNSMVYGSFFHMDAPLWFFWNMTKNFANFALGFIVLFSILKGVFSSFNSKGGDGRSPMEIIKKTLIAGILIQASWFLLAALIDVSTIATYAVGGMPMSLLNDKENSATNQKILQTQSHLELNNIDKINEKDFTIRYKTQVSEPGKDIKDIEISQCLVKTLGTKTYIVGRRDGNKGVNSKDDKNLSTLGETMQIANDKFPTRNICVFGNTVYFFNEFPNTIGKIGTDYTTTLNKNLNIGSEMLPAFEQCKFIINLNSEKENKNTENCGQLIKKAQDTIKAGIKDKKEQQDFETRSQSINNESQLPKDLSNLEYGSTKGENWFSKTAAPTVKQIIDKSKGFVGPFVTIYASIMDFANLSDTSIENGSVGKNTGELIIRAGVAIGLIFPLIALAVVLFIRIGFLWAVIATSPLLILANVFKDSLKIKLGDQFSMANILKAIFAPVITVFALSISVIFMTIISSSLSTHNIDKINVISQLGADLVDGKDLNSPDPENMYLTVAGFTIAYPKIVSTYAGATGDWFSWMIVSFCGIGIMRFILFAAIKATGSIGKVGEGIQKFGENMFKTAPIIPIGSGVGLGTLKENINTGLAEKYRENKVVNYPGQQGNMETYLEQRMPQAMKGADYGKDSSFNSEEKKEIEGLLTGGSNDTNKIIDVLNRQGFIKKGDTPEENQQQIKALYERSPEFQNIMSSQATNSTLISGLFGDAEYISKQQSSTIKNQIDGDLNSTFSDEAGLKAKIGTIKADDIKKLPENYKKTVKIGAEEYEVTKTGESLVSSPVKKATEGPATK